MVGQWLANDWPSVGQLLANGGPMVDLVGQWLTSGWPMVGQWLSNGWQMVGQWLTNGWPMRMAGQCEWLAYGLIRDLKRKHCLMQAQPCAGFLLCQFVAGAGQHTHILSLFVKGSSLSPGSHMHAVQDASTT